MQEKSVPFFRQPKNQDPNQNNYNAPPNLIIQKEYQRYYYQPLRLLTRFFIRTYYIIAIVFGLMLIANWYLNLKLESQKILLNNLSDQVSKYSLVRKQSLEIDAKTKFYQKTLAERVTLGNKTDIVFSNLDNTINVATVHLNQEKFVIDFTVDTPLHFALLVERYLKYPEVAEISLKSADLIPSKKKFSVRIEGKFK